MSRRKRRYYDTYEAIKSHQYKTNRVGEAVNDWEIRDMAVEGLNHLVNKRRRSRIGYVENRKKR